MTVYVATVMVAARVATILEEMMLLESSERVEDAKASVTNARW